MNTIDNDPISPTFSDAFLIASIVVDEGVHPREKMHAGIVKRLRETLKQGAGLAPVTVFIDEAGVAWLADGFHRLQAHVDEGRRHVAAEIRRGSKREATLAAIKINAHHGRRLTNSERRGSVRTVLDDPAAYQLSDTEIAEMCGCDPKTVASEWEKHPVAWEFRSHVRNVRSRHGGRCKMNTLRIGRREAVALGKDATALAPADMVALDRSDDADQREDRPSAAHPIGTTDERSARLRLASAKSAGGRGVPVVSSIDRELVNNAVAAVGILTELTARIGNAAEFGRILCSADSTARERFEEVVDFFVDIWDALIAFEEKQALTNLSEGDDAAE